MSKTNYLTWAQQACDKEKLKEWNEARDLWQKALSYATSGTQNHNWAWARSVYCNTQYHDLRR